jgi:hypothetical protein
LSGISGSPDALSPKRRKFRALPAYATEPVDVG